MFEYSLRRLAGDIGPKRNPKIVGLANHTILIARDGIENPIDDTGAPIRDDDGTIVGVVLVFRDIADRKIAEESLRRSEERLRAMRPHNGKMTPDKVRQLRAEYESGMTQPELAERYDLRRQMVQLITSRKAWRHVA